MSPLHWPPIHAVIDERARAGDRLLLIVAPFVKTDALKRLFDESPPARRFSLVCRWQPGDLVNRVSDLEVFGYLRDRGSDLFLNPLIHMKLFVFESNLALSTSGNVTQRGLGYAGASYANIEVGTVVELTALDWENLYRVLGESRLVTPEIFSRFEEYVAAQPPPPAKGPAVDLFGPAKKYTLASLPATETPASLAAFYFSRVQTSGPSDLARRAYHDLALFQIPRGLAREEFDRTLSEEFQKNPFVVEFLEYLQQERSLRFGAVNTWIHDKCEDVPLPYSWEVKPITHVLYDWLAHCVPEVTWDRPSFSQVIYWKKA